MSTWFITGAARGFGLEIARQALERGDKVVATARNPKAVQDALSQYGDSLLAVALDVTDEAQARAAVEEAVQKFGTIDVLINNAGRGLLGAVEETTDAAFRRSTTPTSSVWPTSPVPCCRSCAASGRAASST